MYVIIVYDVNVERVNKVKSFLRQHLFWIQNSVFEGNISDANLRKLKKELEKLIDPNADRINIYALQSLRYTYKERIGLCTRDGNIC